MGGFSLSNFRSGLLYPGHLAILARPLRSHGRIGASSGKSRGTNRVFDRPSFCDLPSSDDFCRRPECRPGNDGARWFRHWQTPRTGSERIVVSSRGAVGRSGGRLHRGARVPSRSADRPVTFVDGSSAASPVVGSTLVLVHCRSGVQGKHGAVTRGVLRHSTPCAEETRAVRTQQMVHLAPDLSGRLVSDLCAGHHQHSTRDRSITGASTAR